MAWIGDRQDGMIQENRLDTDRGINSQGGGKQISWTKVIQQIYLAHIQQKMSRNERW